MGLRAHGGLRYPLCEETGIPHLHDAMNEILDSFGGLKDRQRRHRKCDDNERNVLDMNAPGWRRHRRRLQEGTCLPTSEPILESFRSQTDLSRAPLFGDRR